MSTTEVCPGMDVVEVAITALDSGVVIEDLGSLGVGERAVVAIDVGPLSGAAYVVQRSSDDAWRTDAVTFARLESGWEWRSEGGSEWTPCPVEIDDPDAGGLGVMETNLTEDDEWQFVTVSGFVARDVATVELVGRSARRTAEPATGTGAYVITLTESVEPPIDPDEIDVIARDWNGDGIDSLRSARELRRSGRPQTLTVAEATAMSNGSAVTVEARLFVLEGQPVLLCDDIDAFVEPPTPVGPVLIVDALSSDDVELSWTPGEFGVSTMTVVMHGVVDNDRLRPST